MSRHARLRARLFAPMLLFAFSAPLAAQYNTPAPRQDMPTGNNNAAPQQPTTAASRADVVRAAACVIGRDATAGDTLLAATPYSGEERDAAVRLLRSAERCLRLRSPIATSAPVLRGAVAEALYEARFAEPAAARAPVIGSASFFRASAVSGREDAALITTWFELAQCTVPLQPGLVRALLATEAATDAESTALTALYPAFSQCVPHGTQLQIDRGSMRALLAESLYRWSVVQRDGATSPWAAAPVTAAAPSN